MSANDGILARSAVRRVVDALALNGLDDRIVVLEETARTATDAANALGVPVGAIVKSLVFGAADRVVIACVAGDRRCVPAALEDVLGVPGPIRPAGAKDVKVATGFTIGGVAPLGHPNALPVALDPSLGRFEAVYAAAGHPHCVFRTSFAELTRLTGGVASEAITEAIGD